MCNMCVMCPLYGDYVAYGRCGRCGRFSSLGRAHKLVMIWRETLHHSRRHTRPAVQKNIHSCVHTRVAAGGSRGQRRGQVIDSRRISQSLHSLVRGAAHRQRSKLVSQLRCRNELLIMEFSGHCDIRVIAIATGTKLSVNSRGSLPQQHLT